MRERENCDAVNAREKKNSAGCQAPVHVRTHLRIYSTASGVHTDFLAAFKKKLPRVKFQHRLFESAASVFGNASDKVSLTVFAPPSPERRLVPASECQLSKQ